MFSVTASSSAGNSSSIKLIGNNWVVERLVGLLRQFAPLNLVSISRVGGT